MQKGIITVGLVAALLLFTGLVLGFFELPGSRAMLLSAAGTFCFIFVPLLIISNFRRENLHGILDKWVFAVLHLMGISFIIGIILKLLNMPCSSFFMRGSLIALIFLIMPVYFISALTAKTDEFYTERRKTQRVIMGVLILMFVGILYALMEMS